MERQALENDADGHAMHLVLEQTLGQVVLSNDYKPEIAQGVITEP